ncbi:TonB-dependent receptor [Myxococcaceae bacterium GXIMD 01537]
MTSRITPLCLLMLLVAPLSGRAQGVPAPASEPRAVEVQVQSRDGGMGISQEDATRLGLGASDGGDVTLVPPSLAADSPAAWPEGLEATAAEVTLELLIDEQGLVSEVTVVQAPSEPRLVDAAKAAAPGLRFSPATLGGTPVSVRLPFVYRFVPPAPRPVLATVKGTVRTKGTRRELAEAALFLDGAPTPVGQTDAQGRFSLEVPAGKHSLEVRAAGHRPRAFEETLSAGQELEVIYRLEAGVLNPYETVVRDERERTEVTRVTLHEQEIREVPGTLGDPFRVVMLMPGVGSLASGISYPVVRGSQPAATGFFLDGVRIPMLYHLLLGPAVVAPDFIDTVDFYPGAPPVQYGRLLGGAVEGRISKPREDRVHATASMDFINSGVFVEAPIPSTGTSITVAGRVSYSALLITLMANALNERDAEKARADFWDYQARIEQKVGEGRLRLFALGSSDAVGVSPDMKYERSMGGGVATRFHRVDLRGTHPLWGGEGEAGVTVGMDELSLTGQQAMREGASLVERQVGEYAMRQTNVAARARWTRRFGDTLELGVGGDVEHRRAAVVVTGTALPPGYPADEPLDPIKSPSSLANFTGAWTELHWRPNERWTVTPGLRADGYHLFPGLTHITLEPRLAVRHALAENLTLKGGAGIFHQPPTVLLHLPVLDTAGLRYGLQEGMQFDVGAEWKPFDGLELSTDVFYNPLARTVEFDLAQVAENRRRRELALPDPSSSGYSYGFELMARHPLGRNWFGWASYSFLQSKRRIRFDRYDDNNRVVESATETLPFAFEQAHVFNAALSYKFNNGWTLGTVLHVNSGRPETGEITSRPMRAITAPDGSPTWTREDRDRAGRLDPFFRVDVRAAKSWAYDDFTLDLSLDILNVSLQSEVLAYTYGYDPNSLTPILQRKPVSIPLVLPMLGLKGTY